MYHSTDSNNQHEDLISVICHIKKQNTRKTILLVDKMSSCKMLYRYFTNLKWLKRSHRSMNGVFDDIIS